MRTTKARRTTAEEIRCRPILRGRFGKDLRDAVDGLCDVAEHATPGRVVPRYEGAAIGARLVLDALRRRGVAIPRTAQIVTGRA